ncbi:GNAT family N-acetyltransferase [Mesorhizobium sp. ZC-5]|uniref:GNAT family N-acetyltransferase n=1 Tax=Mesorhizobium sp. ZC-5 TaxID=2986066 RepID=UPI0021E7B50B|nr:GNAT family N-acetyltransferase [Mesorhizobium sp. ZC-5]MCV3240692.1 GNAT family N-acetyltransferase [Mesorhizobium sp. ZC-5]
MGISAFHGAAFKISGIPEVALMGSATTPLPGVWGAIYATDRNALPSQSPEWGAAVTASGRYSDQTLCYEFSGGRRAILPLFCSGSIFGQYASAASPPNAWGFGGPIADVALDAAHLNAILRDLANRFFMRIQLRPNPLAATLWAEAVPTGWISRPRLAHVLDLSTGYEAIWKSCFRADTRTRIRRAQRAGVEVETGQDERLVDEFHLLLQKSFERWAHIQREPSALARWRGLRRDPRSKFIGMATAMGSNFRVSVARLGGVPIAAIVVLMGRQAHYTRGAMDENLAGPTYANYLLHSMAIKDACDRGCTHYHLGETGNSASLAQFKSRFGAVAVPYAEYFRERLPVSAIDGAARRLVKRLIGFRDG